MLSVNIISKLPFFVVIFSRHFVALFLSVQIIFTKISNSNKWQTFDLLCFNFYSCGKRFLHFVFGMKFHTCHQIRNEIIQERNFIPAEKCEYNKYFDKRRMNSSWGKVFPGIMEDNGAFWGREIVNGN